MSFSFFRFCFDAFSVKQIEMVEMVIQMFKELFSLKMYVILTQFAQLSRQAVKTLCSTLVVPISSGGARGGQMSPSEIFFCSPKFPPPPQDGFNLRKQLMAFQIMACLLTVIGNCFTLVLL